MPDVGDRAGAVLDARLGERPCKQVVDHLQRPVEAEVVRRADPPRTSASTLAVAAHEREVGLRVAAVDRQTSGALTRPPPALELRQVLAVGGEQLLGQLFDRRHLPDERVREQRLVDELAVAGDRGRRGEPLVGGDVLDEPE